MKVVTPLPADVRVIAPSANDVPERLAAFSGTWAGRYTYAGVPGGRHATTQEITLVVERIRREGGTYRASVIFSWDSKMQPFEPPLLAGYDRYEVTISEDGALRFRGRDSGLHTFRVSSEETLSVEQEDPPGMGYRKIYGVLWRVSRTK